MSLPRERARLNGSPWFAAGMPTAVIGEAENVRRSVESRRFFLTERSARCERCGARVPVKKS